MPTLEQIQAKLKKLQAQADILIARKAQAAVDQIRDLMLKHGLTTADIEAKAKASRVARGLHGHASNGKAKVAGAGKSVAKYRDDKTGATWTGHGRAPGWIAGAKDSTQFLIAGASEPKSAAKSAVTRAKGSKGQPKGAQPPKYLNPQTGATWSGRGPAPAWLATVKDRSKFLIEAATAAAGGAGQQAATKAAKKAGKAKSAASRKSAARKVVATKPTVAKKAAAKKATAATRKVVAKKNAAKPAARKSAATRAVRKAPVRKTAAKVPTVAASATPAPAPASV